VAERSMTGIAEGLLASGVANFIGTHWPVGDEAAFAFSNSLYAALLQGARLGEAVLAGRQQLQGMPSVDWADYVHYGSPDFRLAPKV
jgi:CHAT domain-containing protein